MYCSLAPKASARSPRASQNAVGQADFNKCQATTTLKSNLPSPASEARSPDWEGAPERDPHPESTKPSVSAVGGGGAHISCHLPGSTDLLPTGSLAQGPGAERENQTALWGHLEETCTFCCASSRVLLQDWAHQAGHPYPLSSQ